MVSQIMKVPYIASPKNFVHFIRKVSSDIRMSHNVVYSIENIPKTGKHFQIGIPQTTDPSILESFHTTETPKIIFIGDPAVGKTTLANSIKTGKFSPSYNATIGTAYIPIQCRINGQEVKFTFWDTAGEEKTNAVTKKFYRGSDVVVFCFALNEPESLRHIEDWNSRLQDSCDSHCVSFLVGCKSDLPKTIKDDEIQKFCVEHSFEYFETSAKEASNISQFAQRLCYAAAVIKSQSCDVVANQTVTIDVAQPKSPQHQQKGSSCCK